LILPEILDPELNGLHQTLKKEGRESGSTASLRISYWISSVGVIA
jgi:hypothetical protein